MTAPLPHLLVLTDRHQAGGALVEKVRDAVAAGAEAVVLREKDLPVGERRALAERLAAFVPFLVVATDPVLARAVGAAGVHLAAADSLPAPGGDLVVGRSCHSRRDTARADATPIDYVTLSPWAPSPSKPGYGPPLGADGFAAARGARRAYALGGVSAADVRACRDAGAYGVAVMGAVMRAGEPAAVVRAYLDELTAVHP